METLAHLGDRVLTTLTVSNAVPQADWRAALTLLVACALVFAPRIWKVTGLAVTVVHELGHGLTGLLRGRRSLAISISSDHSGLTRSKGTAASAPFSTFWGYPAPAVYGTLLVVAAMYRHAGLALVVSGALLLVSLVFMRGWLAWFLSIAVVVLAGVLAVALPAQWLGYVVAGVGLFFLLGSLRGFGNVLGAHARGDRSSSDAAIMARATRVPAGVWLTLMALVIAVCAAVAMWVAWSAVV